MLLMVLSLCPIEVREVSTSCFVSAFMTLWFMVIMAQSISSHNDRTDISSNYMVWAEIIHFCIYDDISSQQTCNCCCLVLPCSYFFSVYERPNIIPQTPGKPEPASQQADIRSCVYYYFLIFLLIVGWGVGVQSKFSFNTDVGYLLRHQCVTLELQGLCC